MATDRARHHDPGSRFEDAGIPDLQDGTPEQQQAGDPEELPLPGDDPNASVDWGTTAAEQLEGEPLDQKLMRERPDPTMTDLDGDVAMDDEQDDDEAAGAAAADVDPDDVAVGRFANDQAIEPADTDATDFGADSGGLTQEEQAMHLEPEQSE